MDRAREEFETAGAKLVLIGQASPRQAAAFRRRLKLSLPVLADEERASYKAIGAKMASMGELINPAIVAKGAAVTARTGMMQTRTIGSTRQLGGAVVVSRGGEIAWRHLSRDASDNASPQDILAAARAAA